MLLSVQHYDQSPVLRLKFWVGLYTFSVKVITMHFTSLGF